MNSMTSPVGVSTRTVPPTCSRSNAAVFWLIAIGTAAAGTGRVRRRRPGPGDEAGVRGQVLRAEQRGHPAVGLRRAGQRERLQLRRRDHGDAHAAERRAQPALEIRGRGGGGLLRRGPGEQDRRARRAVRQRAAHGRVPGLPAVGGQRGGEHRGQRDGQDDGHEHGTLSAHSAQRHRRARPAGGIAAHGFPCVIIRRLNDARRENVPYRRRLWRAQQGGEWGAKESLFSLNWRNLLVTVHWLRFFLIRS
jgi:hypothetical protein